MNVKGNHPLAEIIAKCLTGIESDLPLQAKQRMVNRAAMRAVKYNHVHQWDEVENFISYLINNCEGDTISDFMLQERLSDFIGSTYSRPVKKLETDMEIKMCSECGLYPADLPGDLCIGCNSYKEHLK